MHAHASRRYRAYEAWSNQKHRCGQCATPVDAREICESCLRHDDRVLWCHECAHPPASPASVVAAAPGAPPRSIEGTPPRSIEGAPPRSIEGAQSRDDEEPRER